MIKKFEILCINNLSVPMKELTKHLLKTDPITAYCGKFDHNGILEITGGKFIFFGEMRSGTLHVQDIKLDLPCSTMVFTNFFEALSPQTTGVLSAKVHHQDATKTFIIEVVDGVISRLNRLV